MEQKSNSRNSCIHSDSIYMTYFRENMQLFMLLLGRVFFYWPKIPKRRFQKLDKIAETLQEGVKLQKHWNLDPSILDIPRSNQCAECSIKVMQELYSVCKNKDKLQLRFILSKKH